MSLDFPVALLAGGLATRLRPLTETVPKSMLEVAGEPFIAHQLRLFRRQGLSRVVVCAGYLGSLIEDFVGDGSRFGLSVTYSFDGADLLGNGGALKRALPLLGPAFAVMYGDSWLDTPYEPIAAAFAASGKSGLITVFRNEGAWDSSNVEFVDGVIWRYDKRNKTPAMHYIDWGLGFLRASALEAWPEGPLDLANVYAQLLSKNDLCGYEVTKRFYEIGSLDGLKETDQHLRSYPAFLG